MFTIDLQVIVGTVHKFGKKMFSHTLSLWVSNILCSPFFSTLNICLSSSHTYIPIIGWWESEAQRYMLWQNAYTLSDAHTAYIKDHFLTMLHTHCERIICFKSAFKYFCSFLSPCVCVWVFLLSSFDLQSQTRTCVCILEHFERWAPLPTDHFYFFINCFRVLFVSRYSHRSLFNCCHWQVE